VPPPAAWRKRHAQPQQSIAAHTPPLGDLPAAWSSPTSGDVEPAPMVHREVLTIRVPATAARLEFCRAGLAHRSRRQPRGADRRRVRENRGPFGIMIFNDFFPNARRFPPSTGLDVLRRPEGRGFQPRPAVALSVRGLPARHSGSLPAQPRHALPRFHTRWCRCPLGYRGQLEGITSH